MHLNNFYARLPIAIEARRTHKMVEVRPQEVTSQTLLKRLLIEHALSPDVVLCTLALCSA